MKYKITKPGDFLNIFLKKKKYNSKSFGICKCFFKSGNISKFNLFVQSVNFIIIFIILLLIVPEKLNRFPINEFYFHGIPVIKLTITLFVYILQSQAVKFWSLDWGIVFETSTKISLIITGILLFCAYFFVATIKSFLKVLIKNISINLNYKIL